MVQRCWLNICPGREFRFQNFHTERYARAWATLGKHGRLYFALNTNILSNSVKYSWIHKSCTLISAHDICLTYEFSDRTLWARLVKNSNKTSSPPTNFQHTSNEAWSLKHLYAGNLPQLWNFTPLSTQISASKFQNCCWCWCWEMYWEQCRFGSWSLVIKLNFCLDFEHKVWSRFWSWSSGEILKLKFGQ